MKKIRVAVAILIFTATVFFSVHYASELYSTQSFSGKIEFAVKLGHEYKFKAAEGDVFMNKYGEVTVTKIKGDDVFLELKPVKYRKNIVSRGDRFEIGIFGDRKIYGIVTNVI
jgi:hypothetical protein